MLLGITLNIFPSSWQKSLGFNQRGAIKLISCLGRKTLCGLIKEVKIKPSKGKVVPVFRGEGETRELPAMKNICNTMAALPARCGGSRGSCSPAGSSGLGSRNPLQEPPGAGCQRRLPGEHLHHHAEKRTSSDASSLSSCPGAKKTAWGPCFCDSVPYWCLAVVWEKNHTV